MPRGAPTRMPKLPYRVRLNTTARGVAPPQLLRRFGWWLATQPTGSLGLLDLYWSEYEGDRGVFCFATLPERRQVALRGIAPAAPVVMLDSSGRSRVTARSLHAFMYQLAAGRAPLVPPATDAMRAELATWLRLNRVRRQ